MSGKHVWLAVAVVVAVAAIGLAIAAHEDIAVAGFFYRGDGHFVGQTALGRGGRYVARSFPFVLLAAFIICYGLGRFGLIGGRFIPGHRAMAYVALTMGLGVGLLVNAFLKEVSHRPRPVHVAEFGGHETFRPFWRFDGACQHNCAFPSGEAASSFWTTAPALLAPPPVRAIALTGAVLFGLAASLLRLAFGGHFLSDVIGGAALVLLINLVLYRWIVRRR